MKEDGIITLSDPGADRPLLELSTLQCVHCGGHFPAKPAKTAAVYGPEAAAKMAAEGKTMRGFCQNCMGPVCGPGCAACVPTDLYLTNLEKGRDPEYRPVVVPVSFG